MNYSYELVKFGCQAGNADPITSILVRVDDLEALVIQLCFGHDRICRFINKIMKSNSNFC